MVSSPRKSTQADEVERNPLNRKTLSPGLWLLKHTQSIVTTITTLAVLKLRSSHIVYYVIGSLTTSFAAKCLKLIIKQPRPEGSSIVHTHGMPSTHSSTISFMGLYLTLTSAFLPFDAAILPPSNLETPLRVSVCLLGLTAPVVVMWSRVRLGLHTRAQTLVGAGLGIFMALLFWLTWNGYESRLSLNSGQVGLGLLRNGIGDTLGKDLDARIMHVEKIVRRKVEL